MKLVVVLAVLVLAGLGVIRFVPIDPARVHTPSHADVPGDVSTATRFVATRQITTTGEGILTAADRMIRATPRTSLLAGDVAEGRISYVTRSAIIGFPDYVTIEALEGDEGTLLVVRSRARFAGYDWGTNKARVEGWLAQLGPLVVSPS